MKVKLCGGYEGDLGSLLASVTMDMPFVPIPGMSIDLVSGRAHVAADPAFEWHTEESVLWVDLQDYDDEFFAVKEVGSIEELAKWFDSNGWTVVEIETPSR